MFDLKEFRSLNKLSQEDAAEYFGCTQPFISQIERGERTIPDSFISKIKNDCLYALPNTYTVSEVELKVISEKESQTENSAACVLCAEKDKQIEYLKERITFFENLIDSQCLNRPLPKTGNGSP